MTEEAPFCECGCGKRVVRNGNGEWNRFINGGHSRRKNTDGTTKIKTKRPRILQFVNEYEKNFILKDKNDNKLIHMRVDGMLVSEVRNIMIQTFKEYMKSEEWNRLRLEVIKKSDGKCVDCKDEIDSGGIVHHEHYDDWGKGNYEEILSCVYVCKKCHVKRHAKTDSQIVPFFAKLVNSQNDCYLSWANNKELCANEF